MKESEIQAAIRAEHPGILWRNNVGALRSSTGQWIRFGLANDSPAMNRNVKSADLIGITPVIITPEHVGKTLGVFTSVECKSSNWKYRNNDKHTAAQMKWLEIVISYGGYATIRNK